MFMGNLRTDKHEQQHVESIHNLFKQYLNFEYIKEKDIVVKGNSQKCKFAFITLRSRYDFNEAYGRLGSFQSRKQLGFNFIKLVYPSQQLIVDYSKGLPKIVKNSSQNIRNSQPVVCAPEWKNSLPNIRNQQPAVAVDLQAEEQYNAIVKQNQKYYREGELLGNETRNKEFKLGSGEHFVTESLKNIVPKYISGFLNSSQQGTLFIGVMDDG